MHLGDLKPSDWLREHIGLSPVGPKLEVGAKIRKVVSIKY